MYLLPNTTRFCRGPPVLALFCPVLAPCFAVSIFLYISAFLNKCLYSFDTDTIKDFELLSLS